MRKWHFACIAQAVLWSASWCMVHALMQCLHCSLTKYLLNWRSHTDFNSSMDVWKERNLYIHRLWGWPSCACQLRSMNRIKLWFCSPCILAPLCPIFQQVTILTSLTAATKDRAVVVAMMTTGVTVDNATCCWVDKLKDYPCVHPLWSRKECTDKRVSTQSHIQTVVIMGKLPRNVLYR